MSVEQYIAGFHSRLDKIATLNLDDKLKGHLLLRQASLQMHEKNMLIGAASGSYDVKNLTAAMRNAYIQQAPAESSMNTRDDANSRPPVRPQTRRDSPRRNDRTSDSNKSSTGSQRPSFYTYKTSSTTSKHGAVLDSGACASVVGKTTLDHTLRALGLSDIPNGTPSREVHRFGNHAETHSTICAVKFPFKCSDDNGVCVAEFDVTFDVIAGELPFLIGLPSLLAMRAALNFRYNTLGLHLGTKYVRVSLVQQDSHLLLPFKGIENNDNRDKRSAPKASGTQYSCSSPSSHYQPAGDPLNTYTYAECCAKSAVPEIPDIQAGDASSQHGTYKPETDFSAEVSSEASLDLSTYLPDAPQSGPISDQYVTSDETDRVQGNGGTTRRLSTKELVKLHVQLKHATVTQMMMYIRSAGLDNGDLKPRVEDAVSGCKCRLAFPPTPHAVASATPLSEDVQAHLAVDVICLRGNRFLHCIDRVTGWSEVGLLCRRDLAEQIRVFNRIQIHKHGLPRTILSDREYSRGEFEAFCVENDILLVPVPAHAHQSNGAIERANRSLRSRFDRLVLLNSRAPTADLVQEAAFGKNINRGAKLASSYELLFNRSPHLPGLDVQPQGRLASVRENNAHLTRRRIHKMLRSTIRNPRTVGVNDDVYIWRDNEGWIGPARVTKVNLHDIEVSHNGSTKSSSMNRVRSLEGIDPRVQLRPGDLGAVQPLPSSNGRRTDFLDVFPLDDYDEDGLASETDTRNECETELPNVGADGVPLHPDGNPVSTEADNARTPPTSIPHSAQNPEEHVCNQALQSGVANDTGRNSEDISHIPSDHGSGQDIPHRLLRSQVGDEIPPTVAPGLHPSRRTNVPSREIRELLDEGNAYIARRPQDDSRTELSTATCPPSSAPPARIVCTRPSSGDIDFLTAALIPDNPRTTEKHDTARPGPTNSLNDTKISSEERRRAYASEFNSWVAEDAFIRVERSSVRKDANVIGSHTVFHRKDDGRVKARIVPWGHRDLERDELRSDSPCANLEIFRLVLSIAAEHAWELGQMDITAAFLQASGFDREVYVRPPKEANDATGLWKLQAAAYGLVNSGRLWYRTSDYALVSEHKLTRSRYEPTLYYAQVDGILAFVLVAQVDNYIYAGMDAQMRSFESFLQNRFLVGALDRRCFSVMGCELNQNVDGTIILTQQSRLTDIDENTLTPPARASKDPDRIANKFELHAYRSMLGKMLYVGRMSNPIMLYHASSMASKVGNLQTHHLKDLKALVKFDKKNVPTLTFVSPNTGTFSLEATSDAAMSKASEGGGRGAFVIVRRSGDVIHPIYWSARKLRRMARSSSTAELLAASDAANALVYLKELLSEITYRPDAALLVDSRSLMNLATSVREPIEPLNKVDLAFLRENFLLSSINEIGWLPGYHNFADGMTKDNKTSAALLLHAFREGTFPRHPDTITNVAENSLTVNDHNIADLNELDGDEWHDHNAIQMQLNTSGENESTDAIAMGDGSSYDVVVHDEHSSLARNNTVPEFAARYSPAIRDELGHSFESSFNAQGKSADIHDATGGDDSLTSVGMLAAIYTPELPDNSGHFDHPPRTLMSAAFSTRYTVPAYSRCPTIIP